MRVSVKCLTLSLFWLTQGLFAAVNLQPGETITLRPSQETEVTCSTGSSARVCKIAHCENYPGAVLFLGYSGYEIVYAHDNRPVVSGMCYKKAASVKEAFALLRSTGQCK